MDWKPKFLRAEADSAQLKNIFREKKLDILCSKELGHRDNSMVWKGTRWISVSHYQKEFQSTCFWSITLGSFGPRYWPRIHQILEWGFQNVKNDPDGITLGWRDLTCGWHWAASYWSSSHHGPHGDLLEGCHCPKLLLMWTTARNVWPRGVPQFWESQSVCPSWSQSVEQLEKPVGNSVWLWTSKGWFDLFIRKRWGRFLLKQFCKVFALSTLRNGLFLHKGTEHVDSHIRVVKCLDHPFLTSRFVILLL